MMKNDDIKYIDYYEALRDADVFKAIESGDITNVTKTFQTVYRRIKGRNNTEPEHGDRTEAHNVESLRVSEEGESS